MNNRDSLNKNNRNFRYDAPRHPFGEDFRAGDLTSQYDGVRIAVMNYYFGTTDWRDFIHLFVAEVGRNRYRGFIKLNIHLDKKCFSWFFRKFDLYLVAIHDGYDLYELGYVGMRNRWLYNAILTGYRERYSELLNNMKIVGTELSAEIFENAARVVLENVGRTWKWRHSFGIYALMFSEPGRFTWFTEAVEKMITDGTIMLLAEEGQGEFDWAAYIPNKWTVICNCLRKRLKDPLPIVHQRLTLDGAKELETNPTAAKTAIWTETWHPSWPIDDGGPGGGGPGDGGLGGGRGGGPGGGRGGGPGGGRGGGPGGGRGGGSQGGRGGGSRGGTSPSYGCGLGLESSSKGGGNFKWVPRPKGRGCVGSTNNIMMATLCFEPFARTTAGPKPMSTRNPKSSFMDYQSCGNNSEMLILPALTVGLEGDSIRMDTLNYREYAGRDRMHQKQGYGGSKRSRYDPLHMSQQPSKRLHGSQNGSYDRNSLPAGWLDCPPYGDAVNFIIPSKVPLGESFNDKIVTVKRYSPQQAILQQRRLGRELGLVIDLTNTDRYYRESDWTRRGIEYVKIRCAGRDSVPDHESVERFIQEVTRFSSQHAHSNKYVLVHCTHGHNRTGYMIVQFLIRSESISLTEAINRFCEARPPGIYKQDYVDHLCNYFGEQLLRTFVCPQTPEWKRSPDRDDDVASGLQDNDLQASQMTNVMGKGDTINVVGAGEMANAMGEDEIGNVTVPREMTNDDKLGETVPLNKVESMRHFCNDVLKLNSRGQRFPGSHPVSLSRENLELLRQQYYYTTWKADGTRYMMLITWHGCYLIDRNFDFISVDLRFPRKANEDLAGNTHNYTLLDGEMVIDTDPIKHRQERRYLIYDLIALDGKSLVDQPFSSRWKLIESEVIKPRNSERDTLRKSENPYYRYDLEPFRVRRKDFYPLTAVPKLLKEFIPRLSHPSDGLIFQPWDDPYVARTHLGLLKWKYPEMNSVDFLLELGSNNRPMLYLYNCGRKELMNGMCVAFRDPSVDMLSLSGKIIECSWDPKANVWVFMRMRPDKSTPNEISTYKKVKRSIQDNITEEDVINKIQDIIRLPMYADRIKAVWTCKSCTFTRVQSVKKPISTRNPKVSFMDYESCGNNSEHTLFNTNGSKTEVVRPIRNSEASKPAEYAQYDETPEAYASTSRKSPFKASTSSKAQTLNANGYASVGHEVDIVEELRKDNHELKQRVGSTEIEMINSLFRDLLSERDKNALLEKQVQKAEEKIKKLDEEHEAIIGIFSDERSRQYDMEASLRKKWHVRSAMILTN